VRRNLRMTGYFSPRTDLLMDAIVPAFLAGRASWRRGRDGEGGTVEHRKAILPSDFASSLLFRSAPADWFSHPTRS
jgi:hypothetical protein